MTPSETARARWRRLFYTRLWRTLRFRFALWIALVVLAITLVFSVFVYLSLKWSLSGTVDDSLRLTAAQMAALYQLEVAGPQPPGALPAQLQEQGFTVRFVDAAGAVVYTAGIYTDFATPPDALAAARSGRATFSRVPDPLEPDDWLRLYMAPMPPTGEGAAGKTAAFVQVVQSLDTVDDTLDQLQALLQIGVPAFVLLAGLSGYWLSGRALAPIDRITETARRISAEDLSTRFDPPAVDDEVGRLAATFNLMLARLEHAFQREQQFTSDASHEMRTPLTIIRAIVEITRSKRRPVEQYEQALDEIYEESSRLRHLVESLLALARENKTPDLNMETVSLDELLQDTLEALRPLAERKGLALSCHIPGDLQITGDYEALARLFLNLLDNAIKYTAQGAVSITGEQQEGGVQVSVADTGCGIPTEHLPHVFERFYRADAARTAGGSGLGLTIARQVVEAHGGSIEISSREHSGTTVTVLLPLQPPV